MTRLILRDQEKGSFHFPLGNHQYCPGVSVFIEGFGRNSLDWFKIGKGIHQGCILSPCLFNLYAESRLPGEISTTSDIQLDTTRMVESEEELNSLLMRVKEESEKAGLKLNIQKNNITASRPITSWQIDRKKVETLTHFTFLGSQITADSDCNHKIKRYWFLGRKAMTHLDSILKSRDITLLTEVRIVKAMVFPVIMYRCESWTIKKAEC